MSKPRSRDSGGADPKRPATGQLLKRRALGTAAIYRVVEENSRGVEVEVVDAPGLDPGSRFTFDIEDVLAMERLDSLWDDLNSD